MTKLTRTNTYIDVELDDRTKNRLIPGNEPVYRRIITFE